MVILALIVKNEYDYIREHIEYHLSLGFDKIYVGDNNDNDGERYEELLSDLIKEGKVEIIDFRGVPSQQIPFYNYIVNNVDYEWCAFIDCDEFLTFNENCGFKNIKDFLNSSKNITNYHINWMCYGDNGQCYKKEGKLVDRFTISMPKNFKENEHIKTILHGSEKKFTWINPHSIMKDNAYSPSKKKVDKLFFSNIDWDILYIRHFYTKSLEEWVKNKMKRSGGNNKNLFYSLDYYFAYNEYTEEKANFLKEKGINYVPKENLFNN